jgi:hypothetical protein
MAPVVVPVAPVVASVTPMAPVVVPVAPVVASVTPVAIPAGQGGRRQRQRQRHDGKNPSQ